MNDDELVKFVKNLQKENKEELESIRKLQSILEKLNSSEDVFYVYSYKLVSNR